MTRFGQGSRSCASRPCSAAEIEVTGHDAGSSSPHMRSDMPIRAVTRRDDGMLKPI